MAASLLAGAWTLSGQPAGRDLAFSLLLGLAFGVVLQRSRFCFYCITRDFIERRETDGLYAILVALAAGTLGYLALFGAMLPVPDTGRLPPGAHIGPISIALVAGAAVFGVGMTVSGSCISAHFYRLGEGHWPSLFALAGAAVGFVLGFLSWNPLYLGLIQAAPVVWLPQHLGYGGTAVVQLALLGALAAWLWRVRQRPVQSSATEVNTQAHRGAHAFSPQPVRLWSLLSERRWPPVAAGLLVGFIGMLAYLRVAPLGVTAELGSLARTGAQSAGWLPDRLQGLDGFAGCATVVKAALLSNNGVFVLGLVGGAWAAALNAGAFKVARASAGKLVRQFAGGVLMGWGGMTALGCTVGTLLSGISAGAASGWVFAVACVLAIAGSLRVAAMLRATRARQA
ncbi:YeeE/YedE family protein [Pseudomonadota bacterium AL_CKDN230030165-1A_HGKHYDSX7]